MRGCAGCERSPTAANKGKSIWVGLPTLNVDDDNRPPPETRRTAVNIDIWLLRISALILCSLLSTALPAAECDPWVAQVVSIQGSVESKRAGQGRWTPITLNESFCAGDSLRVDARARAAVVLRNQTVLRLDGGTTITLSQIETAETSWLDLVRGAVYFITRVPRTLKVRTAFVNAAVEGTEFLVRAEPNETDIRVFDGTVVASNQYGSVTLGSGQAAVARTGTPPIPRLVVRRRDAVTWTLYYPPIIDYRTAIYPAGPDGRSIRNALAHYRNGDLSAAFAALDQVPTGARDVRYFTLRAGLLLSVGKVAEARTDIDRALALDPRSGTGIALQSIIALARNDNDEALAFARQAIEADPQSAVPRIALSYVYQAQFDLDKAMESVQEAVKLAPDNSLAWAQVSEMWLSQGYLRRAEEAAQTAISLDPKLARTETVLGFAHLTQFKIAAAKAAFEQAIRQDPADPLPRLGLGLAAIRENDLTAGTREIEIAATLDPDNSLIRSYLGKAYYQQNREQLAGDEYGIAKALDPKDPTPWYYDAILKQTTNRPVEALHDLQHSIELNDNRAVYRSRLLLDEDLGTRGTSLARVFDDLGFQRTAVIEGTASLSLDPSNYSAHRFLSDSYASQPRHEIARVSELLQAQLLQPINTDPVQPQLPVTDLSVIAQAGPAEPGFNEFSPLFAVERPRLSVAGIVGNNETLADEVIISGLYGRLSYSLGQFHYQTDGYRINNDIRDNVYNAFAQFAVTPSFNVQAELRSRNTNRGDIRLNFDPENFSENTRFDLDEDSARVGAHAALSPRSDILVSLIYADGNENQQVFATINSQPVKFDILTTESGYQAETQYIYRGNQFNTVAGAGTFRTEVDRSITRTPPGPPQPQGSFNREQYTVYSYTNINLPAPVTWTAGLSYESYRQQDLDLARVNPKIGIQWSITEALRLRLAWFKTVKRALLVNQTIEPTQVAGFNQLFDDPNGTTAQTFGAGLDARLSADLFGGVGLSRRDLDVPLTAAGQVVTESRREELARAYLYWTPHPEWALRAEYNFENFKRNTNNALGNPVRVETTAVPVAVEYFNPSGLFTALGATYVHQQVELPSTSSFPDDSEDFVTVNASIGYRLPKRWGIVSVEASNLLDQDFLYQDDNFRNAELRSPRFIPDRTILASITINL